MSNSEKPRQSRNGEASSRRRFLQVASVAAAVGGSVGFGASRSYAASDNGRGGNPADWVTTWAGVAHGAYPLGTAVLQPVLAFAFPNGTTSASEQSFRMIVRPTVWGDTFRFRFSNVFGTQPLTLDNIYVGLQASAGTSG